MRLRVVQGILESQVPKLRLEQTSESIAPGQAGTRVIGLARVREAATALIEVPGLTTEALPLVEHPLIKSSVADTLLVDQNTANVFFRAVAQLADVGGRLLALLRNALPPEEALSVAVRLPAVTSLVDMSAVISDVNDIFAQTLQLAPGYGGVRIIGVDTGTMHIEVALDTVEAIALIVSVVGATARHLLRSRKQQETAEQARKVAEPDEWAIAERLYARMKQTSRDEAISQVAPNASPEDRARLGAAIEKLAELMDRGADVVPALSAPATVRVEYEVSRSLADVEVAPKQLTAEAVSPVPSNDEK